MTHTDKATPRPWELMVADDGTSLIHNPYNDGTISDGLTKANAELIVRAVNSHEALVWALQRAENWMSLNQHYGVLLDDIREALKQAGEA